MFSETYKIYNSAPLQTLKNAEWAGAVKDLSIMFAEVEENIGLLGLPVSGSHEETFLRLCRECKAVNKEFQPALLKLQARGRNKLDLAASSVAKAIKTIWSSDKISEMQERLNQVRQQMIMAVLMFLWYSHHPLNKAQDLMMAGVKAKTKLCDYCRVCESTSRYDRQARPH